MLLTVISISIASDLCYRFSLGYTVKHSGNTNDQPGNESCIAAV